MSAQAGLTLRDERDQAIPLSHVTREHFANVYFSLWLARLETFADQGVLLPVVMEDPLPATRQSRRKAVARLLTQLAARGHQLILVTTSSQSAAAFARLDVPVADLFDRERVPVGRATESAEREAALS